MVTLRAIRSMYPTEKVIEIIKDAELMKKLDKVLDGRKTPYCDIVFTVDEAIRDLAILDEFIPQHKEAIEDVG